MILIDSNVLIDIFHDDPNWFDWSAGRLDEAEASGPLLINDVVYAEVSSRFPGIEELEAALFAARITVAAIPREALFLAGRAFVQYRAAGGQRTGVLPDFFIGAHAAVEALPLLTRDARRYRRYFPKIQIIAPS